MNKPEANTAWAMAESAKKLEPLESQRQLGWVYKDTPSSGVINSWMNAVHQWRVYLEQTGDAQEAHIEALEQYVAQLEVVLKHQVEEIQRHETWLEQIQASLESHPTQPAQAAPAKPAILTPLPGMSSSKWAGIERNNGRGPK